MDVERPVRVPEGDKRFADPAWSENPAFFAVRQGYLAAWQLVSDLLAAGAGGLAGEREKPPPIGSGRHQAIADATGRSDKPTASEEQHE
jgi:hypothetical protein